MRKFWLLTLMAVSCPAFSECCKTALGLDENPPDEVKSALQERGLETFNLIDRKDCKKTIRWLAIPNAYPVDSPRPPGSEHWLILTIKTRKIEFIPAPG